MNDSVAAHAAAVLSATREELARADGKASLLLASSGVAVGALMAGLIAGDWSPFELDNRVEWLWWVGLLAVLLGVVALGLAVYPRTKASSPRGELIAYYGDVVAAPPGELEARLEASVASPRTALLDQLRQVALIVQRKYRAIQFALWAFAVGAFLCTIAVLMHALVGFARAG